jgi:hypothetical protein
VALRSGITSKDDGGLVGIALNNGSALGKDGLSIIPLIFNKWVWQIVWVRQMPLVKPPILVQALRMFSHF